MASKTKSQLFKAFDILSIQLEKDLKKLNKIILELKKIGGEIEKLQLKEDKAFIKAELKKIPLTPVHIPIFGKEEDWHYCEFCQIIRGAKIPKGGQDGMTVMGGICSMCKKYGTLVPNTDYDWPKRGRKAIFD